MAAIIFGIIIGLVLGGVIGYLAAKGRREAPKGIDPVQISENYVPKELYTGTQSQIEARDQEIKNLTAALASSREINNGLSEKITTSQKQIEDIQGQFRAEFKNLATEMLEEKSKKFTEINEKNIGNILNPLKERIKDFEEKVEKTYNEEIREKASLRKELEQIVRLNQQVSQDACRLTKALKGDSKTQGDWGEVQLEMILEKAGLEKDIHFLKQPNYKNEEGQNVRPDYVVNLPEGKNFVLDAKASLTAYERYFNEEDEELKTKYLKEHIASIESHISELGAKNYQKLYEIPQPDYVLMFIPVEAAFTCALRERPELMDKAFNRNIVIVSTSTLLATLRTVSFIWKQENQRKNVMAIAKESGALYDKFVGFMEDLVGVGKKMDDAKAGYSDAMNKLFESQKKGDTIIGRIERLKKLGAQTTKSIPAKILERALTRDETLEDILLEDSEENQENNDGTLPLL